MTTFLTDTVFRGKKMSVLFLNLGILRKDDNNTHDKKYYRRCPNQSTPFSGLPTHHTVSIEVSPVQVPNTLHWPTNIPTARCVVQVSIPRTGLSLELDVDADEQLSLNCSCGQNCGSTQIEVCAVRELIQYLPRLKQLHLMGCCGSAGPYDTTWRLVPGL